MVFVLRMFTYVQKNLYFPGFFRIPSCIVIVQVHLFF